MSYCVNCGAKLSEGDKFCSECGERVVVKGNSSRETVFDGEIHKCPNCGEVLSAFVTVCPSCGLELRGKQATSSIQQFYRDLNATTSVSQKENMIRNFPVPNTREDIYEFLFFASSNIIGENDEELFQAWVAKFEQTYQRALVVIKDENDLHEIEQIREEFYLKVNNAKVDRINKVAMGILVRNIATFIGIIAAIIGVVIDKTGGNSSLVELVAIIVLIASVATLPKRSAPPIDYGIGAVSGVVSILISFLMENGSAYELGGGIVLIVVAVNFFRSLGDRKS